MINEWIILWEKLSKIRNGLMRQLSLLMNLQAHYLGLQHDLEPKRKTISFNYWISAK